MVCPGSGIHRVVGFYAVPHGITGKILGFRLRSGIFCRFHHPICLFASLLERLGGRLPCPVLLFCLPLLSQFLFRRQGSFRNHFLLPQGLSYRVRHEIAERNGICKTDVHFGGMDIHVHPPGIHGNMQHTEGKFMLHQVFLIALFQAPADYLAADKPAVEKVNLKIPVGTHLYRLSQISVYADSTLFRAHRHQFVCHIPSVNPVDDFLQVAAAGSMKTHLSAHHQLKRDVRPGQGQMFHQVHNIAAFRGRLF